MTEKSRYREAGVDLEKASELVRRIQPLVRSTFHSNVITDIGGFGSLYSINCAELRSPVLVSSTDGVGTKLKIASWAGVHDTVGVDLVAMCVNDIVVQGAKPLFFLDYLAVGHMNLDRIEAIVRGIVEGCRQANCSLVGGETAEMPGVYAEDEYDMAGFAVGLVDNPDIIDGSAIHVGDRLLGLTSSGLHSNGFSLVRKVFIEDLRMAPDTHLEDCGKTLAEELLTPTRIYVNPVLRILKQISIPGMAHITGGGFKDNLARILPGRCRAVIEKGAWTVPPIFRMLRHHARMSEEEMYHVFNCGIGLVMVVHEEDANDVMDRLRGMGHEVVLMGEIVARDNGPSVVLK